MSVQVVAAKMSEVELKDVSPGKDLPAESPVTPTSEDKTIARKDPHEAGSSAAEPSAKAGEGSRGLLTPNAAKMPQASALKHPDPQQNGGEAFVNRDGTVAEAPRMKKVSDSTPPPLSGSRTDWVLEQHQDLAALGARAGEAGIVSMLTG